MLRRDRAIRRAHGLPVEPSPTLDMGRTISTYHMYLNDTASLFHTIHIRGSVGHIHPISFLVPSTHSMSISSSSVGLSFDRGSGLFPFQTAHSFFLPLFELCLFRSCFSAVFFFRPSKFIFFILHFIQTLIIWICGIILLIW